MVHALLGFRSLDDLLGHPVVGGSWEGFRTEPLIGSSPPRAEPFFYSSSGGEELDLTLRLPAGEIPAFKIRRTSAPKVSRGFCSAAEGVKASERYLVYAGNHEVPMRERCRSPWWLHFYGPTLTDTVPAVPEF